MWMKSIIHGVHLPADPNMHTDFRMTKERDQLKGQPFSPRNHVSYQEGSIVSRMITYTRQGTITIFAFDTGTGLSEHTAPYDAVIEIIEGTAEITLEGTTHTVREDEMIILPAGIPHAVHASERFKMILTMIHAT